MLYKFRYLTQRTLGELNSDVGQILHGAAAVFVIQFGGVGVMYASQVLLARWAGPFEFGVYAYAWTWVTILALIAPLGLNQSILRFVPVHSAEEEWPLVKGILVISPF